MAVALMAVLAGCSETATPETDQEADVDVDVKATSTTGVIVGLVLDETIRPIEGAVVTVVGQETSATTGADGGFGFEGLQPGTYFLEITKPGYAKVQQSVDVVAGVDEPDMVRVLLTRIPGSEPHVVPHQHDGFIACGFQVANRLYGAETCNVNGMYGEDDADPYFDVDQGPPGYFQSEVIWEHTQEFGKTLTTTQYTCDSVSCDRTPGSPDRFCQVWGESPLLCKVTPSVGWGNADGTGGGEGITTSRLGSEPDGGYVVEMRADCRVCVPATALGVGLILEQHYTVYSHLFYNMEPSEGWQFTVDGGP